MEYLKVSKYRFLINNRNNLSYNVYNSLVNKKIKIKITSNFNTFGGEKNLKLIKLYKFIIILTNQRPVVKLIKFFNIKKKILKRFSLSVDLNRVNQNNLYSYLINFYFYFYHIYYLKNLKFNYNNKELLLYLDNPQFFFKNYPKQGQKIQLKISFYSENLKLSIPYLSNIFLLNKRKKWNI